MLTVSKLSKSFGIETIIKNASFTLNAGERLGLVGPNGSGKTTLLRILAGQDQPDTGSVRRNPPELRVGYLPQGSEIPPEETLGSFLARRTGDLPALAARLEALAIDLTRGSTTSLGAPEALPAHDHLQQEYDAVLARLELVSQNAGRGPEMLAALGLDHLPPDIPSGRLSGGQKTRLALAGVLLSSPQLLLLDEPTNHLDLEMLRWLEDWLAGSTVAAKMGMLIVSHDRAFLDATATGILELDPQDHQMRAYPGNYTDYLAAKIGERERQWEAYTGQQEEIARLRQAAAVVRGKARFRRGGKGDTGDKFAKGFFGNRTLETIRRAKALERRLERLLSEDHIEKPRNTWQMKLDFGEVPATGKDVLRLEDLSIGYPSSNNPGQSLRGEPLVLLKDLNLTVHHKARVAVIGPNGTGKTTLLRTIAGQIPPLSGAVRLGANVRLGYMAQEQEDLDPELDALSTIQHLAPLSETDARAFLHLFLFSGNEVFITVSRLSFGERARLSLASLVARGCNLLLLDEPINHLDIPSRARFEEALAGFTGTILAVVHDRYFIAGFATEVWETAREEITRWAHPVYVTT